MHARYLPIPTGEKLRVRQQDPFGDLGCEESISTLGLSTVQFWDSRLAALDSIHVGTLMDGGWNSRWTCRIVALAHASRHPRR